RARAQGEPALYGDATNPQALHGAGIEYARAVVIVLSDPFASARATAAIRQVSASVPVLVRTRYRLEVDQLRALGATLAVAEEVETSLELLSQLLATLHVPGNQIEADLELLRQVVPGMRRLAAPAFPLDQALPEIGQVPINSHQLEPGSWAIGRTLADTQLRGRTGVTALAVQTDTGYLAPPPIHRPLEAGDVLFLMGERDAIPLARRLLLAGPEPANVLAPAAAE
ncbi:MAG TPA: NAD-binding protein, partial [Methylomirabilota bacterium]